MGAHQDGADAPARRVSDASHPTSRPRDAARATTLARALLWVPGVVWLAGTPLLFVLAVAQSLTFLGEQVSPEQQRATTVGLIWAAVFCAGAPIVGFVVAGLARSRRALRLYGVAIVIGLLPGLYWTAQVDARNPPPVERVSTCQEHSGGDTRCPGG